MLNEVILACKTYDIMRYYHVKEMSLSYDCVLVLSLIESVHYPGQNILIVQDVKLIWKSFVCWKIQKFEYSPHHSESECGISTFTSSMMRQKWYKNSYRLSLILTYCIFQNSLRSQVRLLFKFSFYKSKWLRKLIWNFQRYLLK